MPSCDCHWTPLSQVMAWWRRKTSHCLGQCWPRPSKQDGVTWPQWVKARTSECGAGPKLRPRILTTSVFITWARASNLKYTAIFSGITMLFSAPYIAYMTQIKVFIQKLVNWECLAGGHSWCRFRGARYDRATAVHLVTGHPWRVFTRGWSILEWAAGWRRDWAPRWRLCGWPPNDIPH